MARHSTHEETWIRIYCCVNAPTFQIFIALTVTFFKKAIQREIDEAFLPHFDEFKWPGIFQREDKRKFSDTYLKYLNAWRNTHNRH